MLPKSVVYSDILIREFEDALRETIRTHALVKQHHGKTQMPFVMVYASSRVTP
jgi:hypothetical protein